MDFRPWYRAALADDNAAVMRLRLRPYTVGHELLLCLMASPFTIGKIPNRFDLITACLICSLPYSKAKEIQKHVGWWTLALLRFLNRKANLREEFKRFMAYRDAGKWTPECNEVKGARRLKSPNVLRLALFLMHKCGCSWDEAMDYPISRANALYFCWGDMEHAIDLFGEEDETGVDALHDLKARGLIPANPIEKQ